MKKTFLKRYLLEIENEIRITVVEKIINGHPLILFHKRSRALSIFSIYNYSDDYQNWTLWLARSFASSRYNHRAVIITLRAVFKMAARFIDDSESEIDKLKKNAVPRKTKLKMLQNLESSYSKVAFASNMIYWKLVCLFTFFTQSVGFF